MQHSMAKQNNYYYLVGMIAFKGMAMAELQFPLTPTFYIVMWPTQKESGI